MKGKVLIMNTQDIVSITPHDPADVQTSISDPYMDHVAAAGRKMEQTAHKAVIPPRYQMVLGELDYLYELMKQEGDPYNALCIAFDYGFVKGCRATRRGKVKAL